jgi:hypothetical protein
MEARPPETRMSDLAPDLPPEQQAIRARCVHPTGSFVEFKQADIEQSIPIISASRRMTA